MVPLMSNMPDAFESPRKGHEIWFPPKKYPLVDFFAIRETNTPNNTTEMRYKIKIVMSNELNCMKAPTHQSVIKLLKFGVRIK